MTKFTNKEQLVKAKIAAYAAWLELDPDLLTDAEVDIGFMLSKDPDVQEHLEKFKEEFGHYPSGHVQP